MTSKQYLKEHPEKYVLVTREFGEPIFIAPCSLTQINVTDDMHKAEKWTALDNGNIAKLSYHIAATGYKGLAFEQI